MTVSARTSADLTDNRRLDEAVPYPVDMLALIDSPPDVVLPVAATALVHANVDDVTLAAGDPACQG